MRWKVSCVVALMLAVALPAWAQEGTTAGRQQETQAQAQIGKPAPDFTLKDINGREVKLSSFQGKIVVLEWTNHQCPVVGRYYKANAMANTQKQFEGKPVVWLAIDSNSFCEEKLEDIRTWAKEKGVTWPILLDAPGEVGRKYGAKTTPHLFVIDAKGVLAYRGSLDDDERGNKANPRNYVAEAISALLEGSTVPMPETKPFGNAIKYKT